MDPDVKNKYQFFYSRTPPSSLRFVGIFVVIAMFAAIPVLVLTINQQTKSNTRAAGIAISPTPSAILSETPIATPTAIIKITPTSN